MPLNKAVQTVVITGANRGIGLSFVKHYLNQGYSVYAICRKSSAQLEELLITGVATGDVTDSLKIIEGIDVSSPASVESLTQSLASIQIDLLINNAGVLHNEVLGNIDFASIETQFHINALGPLRVTETLAKNLAANAKVVMITSRMGSIADNTSGGRYGYRMSKAALNIASVSLAHDLAPHGIAVGIFHPGLVGTDMIGGQGDITPDQAAERITKGIDGLTMDKTGTFWHSNGEILPW